AEQYPYGDKTPLDHITRPHMHLTPVIVPAVERRVKGEMVAEVLSSVETAEPGMTAIDKLRRFIIDRGISTVVIADLVPILGIVKRDRTWLYKVLDKLEDDGFVARDDHTKARAKWTVLELVPENNLAKAQAFVHSSMRRAKGYGSPIDDTVTAEQVLPLYDEPNCYLCNEPIKPGKRQIDHKNPLSRGGAHALDNFAASDAFCNNSKGDKTEAEYRRALSRA
ncbi:MAG: HNH endonuclease, partial [Candidatus Saccharimonadales bacterium]